MATLKQLFMDNLTLVFFCALACVEIVPVKINPLEWVGKRIYAPVLKEVKIIRTDLQNHVADDMRTYILDFQNQELRGLKHTEEEYSRANKMCDDYEEYVKVNKLKNSQAVLAIVYIRKTYMSRKEQGDFLQ